MPPPPPTSTSFDRIFPITYIQKSAPSSVSTVLRHTAKLRKRRCSYGERAVIIVHFRCV
ncbi:hypothetical protein BC834DRAFT_905164 [Gloeopeniophorella convolvens]|nr:hypothetical protein BC834DRAFT_905164 [Gloeopeniophorella convolvens]